MAGLFDSHVDEVIQGGLVRVLENERRLGLEQTAKNWDFYNNNQIGYLKQYPGELEDEFDAKKKCPFNYTKIVVDEYISGVYQSPVRRTFSSEVNNDIVTKIGESFQYDPFFRKVQLIAEISAICGVMIRTDPSKSVLFLEAIPGEYIKICPDSRYPDGIGHVIISYNFDADTGEGGVGRRVEGWSREKVVVFEKIGKKVTKTFSAKNEFKDAYGMPFIPIVFFRPEECATSLYGQTGVDITVEINNAYNGMWMDIMRTVQLQQFSVLVMKRPADIIAGEAVPDKIQISPTRLLELTTKDADAKYITPSPLINESLNALAALKKELLDLSRVPVEKLSGGDRAGVESAETLHLKSIPIENLWENRRASYGTSDIELFKKIIMYHKNVWGTGDTSDLIANIDFKEHAKIQSTEEEREQTAFDLNLGLTNPVELMLKRDPDMGSEEDARARIAKNQEITKSVMGTGVKSPEESVDDFLKRIQEFRQVSHMASDEIDV